MGRGGRVIYTGKRGGKMETRDEKERETGLMPLQPANVIATERG